jgi:hypothetical protein
MCRPPEQGIVPTNVRPDAAHAQLQNRALVRENSSTVGQRAAARIC